ncbi:hypothetical protein BJAS_P3392 [Bathymodiolus japonicus methanotrophic gill symbiont]|uniref:hypothetical protein n=1 Tax=Bathymodiolus japonicus methanotrophic gill symbiont TaxID=113269 RepID=UPI001B596401|nr:hypothetical protein [Bathymodiolus japonicus methanotrophic gill symbiont]GFO72858.1 hypothetical protein BJAS_P3392 [Bathymodiolus japonicus methanotrophic gill symbiont]
MNTNKLENKKGIKNKKVIKVFISLFICAIILNVSIAGLLLKQYQPEILDLLYYSFKSKQVDRVPEIYADKDAIDAHNDALNDYKKTVEDYNEAVKVYRSSKKDYEVAVAAMNMADQNSKYAVIKLTKLIVMVK